MKKTKTQEREYHYYYVIMARQSRIIRVSTPLRKIFEEALKGRIIVEGATEAEIYRKLDEGGSLYSL